MFETLKFNFYADRMLGLFKKAAAKVKNEGNNEQALLFLRKAQEAGHAAMIIQSPKISKQRRAAVADAISVGRDLYQRVLIAQMPEEDRALLMSVLQSWADLGVVPIGAHPIDQRVGMFEIARDRLGDDKEVLGMIYNGGHVPPPLRNIMQPFLAGDVPRD